MGPPRPECVRQFHGDDIRYDTRSRRLAGIQTQSGNVRLQAIHYFYDAAGNLTSTRDELSEVQFFGNAQVTADRFYTYDAAYRLTDATGREHAVAPLAAEDEDVSAFMPIGSRTIFVRSDGTVTSTATTGWATCSDPALGARNNWTRRLQDAAGTDRVDQINPGRVVAQFQFQYDPHGGYFRMRQLRRSSCGTFAIASSKLISVVADGCTNIYDGTGRRIRKVVRFQNGVVREFVYLGHWRTRAST